MYITLQVAAPTTSEEFERLVMSSPDSSLVWVQYMALEMESGKYWPLIGQYLLILISYWSGHLETARSIAKRALERINFRLEDERLNIFLAWLNLENSFGTEEAMAAVLKDALSRCDEFKIYSQVATIYSQSGREIKFVFNISNSLFLMILTNHSSSLFQRLSY